MPYAVYSIDPPTTYAGFWIRAAASLIDTIVLVVVLAMVGFSAGFLLSWPVDVLDDALSLIGLVGSWLYYACLESSSAQATIGKRAFDLTVTDEAGQRISFGLASGRFFASLLSGLIFNIGYLMVAFTQRKQGLHDMMSGCFVLRSEPEAELKRILAKRPDERERLAPAQVRMLVVGR